jgi:two-component system nitrogen regulation sensor histidine kinase NtrY
VTAHQATGAQPSAGSWPRRLPFFFLLAALLLGGLGRLHVRFQERAWDREVGLRLQASLEKVEERKRRLVSDLEVAADRVAALPDALPALGGDRAALARLFRALDALGDDRGERPALALHALPFATLAWTSRTADLRGLEAIGGIRRGVFVLAGSVTTTLVATAPVPGPGGQVRGLATAEVPVKVQRNIHNEYLSDFDRLAGGDPGVDIHYVDARDEGPRGFPPSPSGVPAREAVLKGPSGLLGAVRITAPGREEASRALALLYRRATSALACAAILFWTVAPLGGRPGLGWRLLLATTALRLVMLALGPPLPSPASPLLSPDVYASTLLGPLLKNPLDLFATSLWVLLAAGLLLARALAAAPTSPSAPRALASALLALPLLGGVFAWASDTSANCSLDLETISLFPASASHLVIQISLLLILSTGLLLLTALFSLGGPWPPGRWARTGHLLGGAGLGVLAYQMWPRAPVGLPLLPGIALVLLAAALAGGRHFWEPRLLAASAGARAGLAVAAVGLLALLLYPSLVHFAERNTRLQIERDHAPLIRRQPQWREYILAESQRRIDALNLLEDTPSGPGPAGIEELAFAVWSATDLATFSFSSAVEIQDAAGVVISRFALNLPTLSVAGPPRPLPPDDAWRVEEERMTLASAERHVRHARRRLSYHGVAHGAVHVYVAEDFWNLPFIPGRDPYSLLFRTGGRTAARDPSASLLVYDAQGRVVFSSADRPPALHPELAARVGENPAGLWVALPLDGRPHHTFLFSDGQATYGLAFPELATGRYAADLVEACAGLTLLALLVLLLVILVRSLARRPTLSLSSVRETVRGRFALRLFLAFIAVSIVPVTVLEVVVRRFLVERLHRESEDQALERAAVAKKAVEDFAFFQRGESPGKEPVTDAALVWVSSLIRNDLDVFGRGLLLASSKRELYASGLLPPRVSGSVFRALILDQMPSVLGTERIGTFSTLVVSVPVHLDPLEPGVLSIPLALGQKEVQTTLEELDRTIRLASVAFLVLAAALAQSMARRISGPIRDLTRATRLVAAGDLEARVTTSSRDELRELVESFNQMARDLDRQRRDLERSNRLAAWAEMARQVAHDVKNPLTPIQLSAEHLRRVFHDPDVDFAATLAACTDTILKQVRTLRGIVTEFSAFARPPAPQLEPQDLAAVARDAVAPYLAGLPPGVRLSLDVAPHLPPVRLDRRLVERALLNLVENALQAVGERGTITVHVRPGPGRVEMEVEDSGPGLEPEARDRIFEPSFSTKTSGSGLGLALVKKIAEDHGGGVSLTSAPGTPTRAVLWLPTDSAA